MSNYCAKEIDTLIAIVFELEKDMFRIFTFNRDIY